MKKITLVAIFLICLLNAQSQSISRDVVSSSGDYYEGASLSVSWTVGETVVETFDDGSYTLCQGFQQSWTTTAINNCQTITLPVGWSIFSTYIDPFTPNIDSIFQSIVQDVVIVKDGDGLVYWPQFGLNVIGSLSIGKGYQAKMLLANLTEICGTVVTPETTVIMIPQGWSMIGYLRQAPADIAVMMSPVVSEIELVKNGSGQVYWPQFNLNAIGNMIPGKGYQIKLYSPQSFYYPANNNTAKTSYPVQYQSKYYGQVQNTGNNMTIGIPLDAWTHELQFGDEVAVKSKTGRIVGSSVYTKRNMAIAVWGNDVLSSNMDGMMDDEPFEIFVRPLNEEKEYKLEIEFWEMGDALFNTNKVSVVGNCRIPDLDANSEDQFYSRVYPNPVSESVHFEFYLTTPDHVTIKIIDALGKSVEIPANSDFDQGLHTIHFSRSKLKAGNYYYQIITNKLSSQGKLIVI
jgi:hypothetical protein